MLDITTNGELFTLDLAMLRFDSHPCSRYGNLVALCHMVSQYASSLSSPHQIYMYHHQYYTHHPLILIVCGRDAVA
jgi:hypothetical protein